MWDSQYANLRVGAALLLFQVAVRILLLVVYISNVAGPSHYYFFLEVIHKGKEIY